jgi:hypothetical protein
MEKEQDQPECKRFGQYHYCSERRDCAVKEWYEALHWLEKQGFRKHGDPPQKSDYLIGPLQDAVAEARAKYPYKDFTHSYNVFQCGGHPDCSECPDMENCLNPQGIKVKHDNERQKRKRVGFIVARLKKAKENRVRELRAMADRNLEEAAAVDASGPRGPGRFPPGWMRDASKAGRGPRHLFDLVMLVRELTNPHSSDLLTDGILASGRWKREELCEHYTDKNRQARCWRAALFKMDYGRARMRYGWSEGKTNRLLRLACRAGVFVKIGKLPPENGQMVYCAGVWMTNEGLSWVRWFFKRDDYWISVFRGFRLT